LHDDLSYGLVITWRILKENLWISTSKPLQVERGPAVLFLGKALLRSLYFTEVIMRSGFKVGRLFGINIYIDWSWILIFLLVTWNLAGAIFPRLHPDWSPTLNIVMGLVASLLFFLSILLHELAHSLVAKARGLPVRNITLFFFGGVSNIEREPTSPGTEFLMAIVGPLTSIALGFAFLWLGSQNITGMNTALDNPTGLLQGLDPISTMLLWLGPINIIIGLFNLIPAFPLDGGRVLRSIFWAITDNFRRATRWANAIGQGFGWLMILAGVAMIFGANLPILGTGFINGMWFAFIGWFLVNAAAQSYQQVLVQDMLEGIPITRLMREPAPAISPELPISTLVYEHVMRGDERAFPVVDGDRLLGVVYIENLRDVDRSAWDTTTVRQVMVPEKELEVVTTRDDAMDAFQKLAHRDMRQIPVVQNGQLIGMLRRRDILRWLQVRSEMAGS
jgi:Zn-dependent protease/predicted transcriptional regulator